MARKELLSGVAVVLIGGVALIWPHDAAQAQSNPDCEVVYEAIVPMRTPDFDQAALWKKTLGIQGIDRPRALMRVADGGVIAVGESLPYSEKEGLGSAGLQMIRLAADGKVTVDTQLAVGDLMRVADAVLQKTRVVVLASLQKDGGGQMALVYLDGKGEKKDVKILDDPDRFLTPERFVPLSSGGFVVLAKAGLKRKKMLPYTVLVWVDPDGSVRTVKEYLPGVQTWPSSISKTSDGKLIVAGRVMTEKNQQAGWLFQVGTDGTLDFQRPYTRGADATLRYATGLKHGGVLAVGDAIPSGEGDKAAWVLKTDEQGNPVWQKFLTGKYSYAAVDALELKDGRIMTLWAASPTLFGGRKFARLVTFSPTGQILSDESFLEGLNSIPFRLIENEDMRVLLGMAETGFAQDQRPDELQFVTYDSWIMAMPDLPEWKNNCADAPERILDDLPLE